MRPVHTTLKLTIYTYQRMKTKRRKRLHLYLINDDDNTFEHVVETLMSRCNQNYYQSLQCANIVHSVGQVEIKSGFIPEIFDMYLELSRAGLDVELRKRK